MIYHARVWLLCLAVLPWIAGCIDSKTTVHVEKDGSGKVQHVIYTKIPDLGPDLKITGAQQLEQQKTEAEQNAQSMGEGVSVESVKALPDRGEWKGFEIVYAFTDINNLKVKPMPKADTPAAPGAPPAEAKDDQIKFEYAAGKLTVTMPPMDATGGAADAQDGPPPEAMLGMLQEMFKDMKVQIQVQVAGQITECDASFVSPSKTKVGLMRMDVGGLMKDKAAFKEMMATSKIKDRDEIAAKLKAKPLSKYMQVETKEKVEITFE